MRVIVRSLPIALGLAITLIGGAISKCRPAGRSWASGDLKASRTREPGVVNPHRRRFAPILGKKRPVRSMYAR